VAHKSTAFLLLFSSTLQVNPDCVSILLNQCLQIAQGLRSLQRAKAHPFSRNFKIEFGISGKVDEQPA